MLSVAELPLCRLATWADVEGWTTEIARKIRDADRIPEAVIGLTRGGWVPARLVADRLGVKRLIALQTAHWGLTATRSGKAELTEALSVSVEGQSVLVVDDITDTGESLALATAHVEAAGRPGRLESAAFLHITHSKFLPTYFAEEVPAEKWVWVVFPWTYWEDLRTLAQRALPEGRDAAGVARVLRQVAHLTVPPEDVERALGDAPLPRTA